MIKVPSEFSTPDLRPYPSDNTPDFENWFKEHYEGGTDRVYLPVMWTAFYKQADFGNNRQKIRKLQMFLDALDKNVKYFTIVQYDDGILNTINHLDIKVFSMSGRPMHYPLPLLCQPHMHEPKEIPRIFEANFIGSNTHALRNEILKINRKHWFIDSKHYKLAYYCKVLASSVFTLCPRGYGPTSFRIMEALRYGSIPVYISDVHIMPHHLPFDYGVIVTPEMNYELWDLLAAYDVKALQARGREVYQKYFTFESNRQIILQHANY